MSNPEHYVGHESFARNLFMDFKKGLSQDRTDLVWLNLKPEDRAYWRRMAALLLAEGRKQGPHVLFTGKSTIQFHEGTQGRKSAE